MNVMIDIETLDTAATAVVLSIGAVAFTDDGVECGKFYVELTDDLETQQNAGRTISADTVRWWISQNENAKSLFKDKPIDDPDRVGVATALSSLNKFLNAHGPAEKIKMWANGSDFDNVIMHSLYESFGTRAPWKHYNHRCYRTFKNLPGAPKAATREGVHHNALDDAMHQYKHWTEINSWLRNQG